MDIHVLAAVSIWLDKLEPDELFACVMSVEYNLPFLETEKVYSKISNHLQSDGLFHQDIGEAILEYNRTHESPY